MSADTKIVKIWDQATGKGFTSIEPEADINDVCLWPGSGALRQPAPKPFFPLTLLSQEPRFEARRDLERISRAEIC